MTQSQNTADRIDATHRANHYPDDAPTRAIATALDGRSLIDVAISQDVDPVCRRCEEKNEKRRMAGIDLADPALDDGDRVTFHAIHRDDDDDPLQRPHWLITSISHAQHPRLDFDDVITSGTALVRARATIFERQDGRMHVIDVDIQQRSTRSEGPEQSLVDERQQQFIDDDPDLPDMTVIDLPADEPPASWPQLDRDWLDRLVDEHGTLEVPTYDAGAPGNIDVNPMGRDR